MYTILIKRKPENSIGIYLGPDNVRLEGRVEVEDCGTGRCRVPCTRTTSLRFVAIPPMLHKAMTAKVSQVHQYSDPKV